MECVLFTLLCDEEWLIFGLNVEGHDEEGFDVYQIPDALDPEAPMDASVFLNGTSGRGRGCRASTQCLCVDDRVRAAIHAPTSKNWTDSINYPFSTSRCEI